MCRIQRATAADSLADCLRGMLRLTQQGLGQGALGGLQLSQEEGHTNEEEPVVKQ